MPGTFNSYFLVAFDLDDAGHPVRASHPLSATSEGAAVEDARNLARSHAGAVVWKREGDPVLGEESEPVIIFQTGRIGDFG